MSKGLVQWFSRLASIISLHISSSVAARIFLEVDEHSERMALPGDTSQRRATSTEQGLIAELSGDIVHKRHMKAPFRHIQIFYEDANCRDRYHDEV